jgi:formylmethanofuran dehydrogenase subunit E
MLRILVLVAIVWIIYRLFFHKRKIAEADNKGEKRLSAVRCAFCGIYVDKSDAVSEKDLFFCSRDHYLSYKDKDPK